MNFDKLVTTLTLAGIAGAVLLNYQGANMLLVALGNDAVNYVKAVQARPA